MKVCILSDSHDNIRSLVAAAEQAVADGAEAVLHCGDVVAPSSLSRLLKLGVPLHVIHGNNTGDLFTMARMACEHAGLLHYYGQDADLELAGRRVFLVHYPHYGRAMASTGEYDLVCCGHDHRPKVQQIPNLLGSASWLVNPGTVGGIGHRATYVMGDLAAMHFEILDVQAAAVGGIASGAPGH